MTHAERTNGLVSPAQMDTTEYPPEGQNEECDTAAQTDTQEHPDISASTTSDTLPEYECDHALAGLLPEPDGTLAITEFAYCPKCGEKL